MNRNEAVKVGEKVRGSWGKERKEGKEREDERERCGGGGMLDR